MGGSVVPLLKVERLGKPFEGVIAMRDSRFEPLAETAGQAASSVAIIESERRPALRVTVPAALSQASERLVGSAGQLPRDRAECLAALRAAGR
jgi:hypothetical protein